mgnify:FL=1
MEFVLQAFSYLASLENWEGPNGFAVRVAQHLGYTGLAVLIAGLLAVPVGVLVGHRQKGASIILGAAGAMRALPALGMLTFFAIALPHGVTLPLIPATCTLVLLAAAPLLAGVVAGFAAIDTDVVHSARAVGFTEAQILTRVELPLAAPAIIGGFRSCVIQVLATATVVAFIGLGGLGRYLIDGLAVQDYPQMVAGALAVTGLALLVDLLLAAAQRMAGKRARLAPGAREH